jgi:beta-N-acetylhexosaminidase
MASERATRAEVLERLLLGFHGATVPQEIAALLGEGLSGVAIYPRNFNSPEELRALADSLRRAAAGPLLIGIDQEGGTQFSLPPPFTAWPSPADLGRIGNAALVEQVARAIAVELRAAGVNTDFAPMLDLAVNPESPVTKGRSFGRAPGEVARLGAAFLRGLAAEGVLGCAKHFPGHGDTTLDPHLDLPIFDGTRERLQQEEFVPFAAAIQAHAPMIMTAHILLPKIDPNLPASISPAVLEGMLRRDLKFGGVILADDLGMGALARRYGCGDSAVMTLQAGTDIAMLCHDSSVVPRVIDAVKAALDGGRFAPEKWAASRAHIAMLRKQISDAEKSAPPLAVIGCRAHRLLAQDAQDRLAKLERDGTTGTPSANKPRR